MKKQPNTCNTKIKYSPLQLSIDFVNATNLPNDESTTSEIKTSILENQTATIIYFTTMAVCQYLVLDINEYNSATMIKRYICS